MGGEGAWGSSSSDRMEPADWPVEPGKAPRLNEDTPAAGTPALPPPPPPLPAPPASAVASRADSCEKDAGVAAPASSGRGCCRVVAAVVAAAPWLLGDLTKAWSSRSAAAGSRCRGGRCRWRRRSIWSQCGTVASGSATASIVTHSQARGCKGPMVAALAACSSWRRHSSRVMRPCRSVACSCCMRARRPHMRGDGTVAVRVVVTVAAVAVDADAGGAREDGGRQQGDGEAERQHDHQRVQQQQRGRQRQRNAQRHCHHQRRAELGQQLRHVERRQPLHSEPQVLSCGRSTRGGGDGRARDRQCIVRLCAQPHISVAAAATNDDGTGAIPVVVAAAAVTTAAS